MLLDDSILGKRSPLSHSTVRNLIGAVFLGGLSLMACSNLDSDVARDDEGRVAEEGEIGAMRLQVGDCLGDLDEGVVESVPGIPCEEEHRYEVFHAFDLPSGDYPGTAMITTSANDGCLSAFEPYVGLDLETSIFRITPLTPTEDTWNRHDDREVLCLLSDFDESTKTGSAKGSGS